MVRLKLITKTHDLLILGRLSVRADQFCGEWQQLLKHNPLLSLQRALLTVFDDDDAAFRPLLTLEGGGELCGAVSLV